MLTCNVCFLLEKVRELFSAIKECEGQKGAEKQREERSREFLEAVEKWNVELAMP